MTTEEIASSLRQDAARHREKDMGRLRDAARQMGVNKLRDGS